MEAWTRSLFHWLLAILALPKVGLSTIFLVSLASATLLPLGSEAVVFAYVKTVPSMFWPAVVTATVGNTIGGTISYLMGLAAHKALVRWEATRRRNARRESSGSVAPVASAAAPGLAGGRWHVRIGWWLHRFGPAVLFFSWLPIVGDPLCAVAGWFRLSFWPSVFYMALGKFLRYVVMTAGLLWVFPYIF
ncbi:MAG: DedA family protein [Burkholderiaceae bacterium]|nr:MAG: DedA family protein [Burkholderiaceae bacterium]TAM04193.1 MAG: DedA family protein [Pusillimonas sp.]